VGRGYFLSAAVRAEGELDCFVAALLAVVLGAQRSPASRQAGCQVHRMALAAQVGHQAVGNPGVVFQHQHAHRLIVRGAAADGLRRLIST
jgi:hypothetical protein